MRLRERLPDIGLEVFSVVLAVLSALFVNEWRQDRDDSRLAARAMAAVVDELCTNREELVDVVSDHATSLDSLRAAIVAIDAGVDTAGRSVQYDVALLKATAWETARMTQVIIHMDYDAVADLSGIYEVQGLYARMTDDFVEIMLRQERPSSVSEVREMYRYHTGYISNLAKLGKQLRGEYDRFLQLSE